MIAVSTNFMNHGVKFNSFAVYLACNKLSLWMFLDHLLPIEYIFPHIYNVIPYHRYQSIKIHRQFDIQFIRICLDLFVGSFSLTASLNREQQDQDKPSDVHIMFYCSLLRLAARLNQPTSKSSANMEELNIKSVQISNHIV